MATSCNPVRAARQLAEGSSIVTKIAMIWGMFIVLAIVATQVLHAREAARTDTVAGYFEQFD